MIFFRVSAISTGSAAVFDSAFAPCHGSRLFTLRLLFNHSPAVSFLTSPALGSFSRGLPSLRGLPGANALFVPPLGVFLLAVSTFIFKPARVIRPCSSTVATDHPHGNCDSSKLETRLNYLTRSGAVSNRSSPPSSFFALLARANVPEELVNTASRNLRSVSEEPDQPA
jgi:hypothetical protein